VTSPPPSTVALWATVQTKEASGTRASRKKARPRNVRSNHGATQATPKCTAMRSVAGALSSSGVVVGEDGPYPNAVTVEQREVMAPERGFRSGLGSRVQP